MVGKQGTFVFFFFFFKLILFVIILGENWSLNLSVFPMKIAKEAGIVKQKSIVLYC